MNIRLALLGAAMATACQPPPEVVLNGTDNPGDLTPDIEIVFPPQSNDAGNGPYEITALPASGDWNVIVALDVDNLVYVDPYTDPAPDLVDGQGHWHLDTDVAGLGTLVSFTGAAELTVPAESFTAGNTAILTITLRDNKHAVQLDDNGNEISATVEVKLVDD